MSIRMLDRTENPPTIKIDGAYLRPLHLTDAAAVYAYLSDPAVTELTSYPAISIEMVEGMLERYQNRWAAGELSKWGIAVGNSDQIVGLCGFNDWSKAHRSAELAYDLAPAYWGRGVMRKVIQALLQWTFAQDQVDRVHAFVRIDNARSIGLLERCGFIREGRLRSYRICRGQAYDYFVYSVLRADWQREDRHK